MAKTLQILLAFCAFGLCYSARREIVFGAIFGADENEEEISFKAALERAGMSGTHLRFTPSIIPTSRDDPYRVSKAACQLGGAGVAAFLGTAPAASAAAKLEIPALFVDWENPQERYLASNRMTANLYPDPVSLSSALAALVSDYDWTSFTVLYDHDDGLVRLQQVLKSHGPESPPVTVRQLKPGEDNRPLLKEIQANGETRIILDCATDRIMDYLRQAHDVNLFQDYQSYILTSLDAHTIDFADLKYGLANVTSLRMYDPDSVAIKELVRDWRTGGWRGSHVYLRSVLVSDAVNHISKAMNDLQGNFALRTRPLACNESKTSEYGFSILQYMKAKPTEGVTGIIELDEYGRRSNFQLDIVEQTKSGFKKIGTWNSKKGVAYSRTEGEVHEQLAERWQNKTFIVSSRIGAPYLMWKQAKDGEKLVGNDRFEGYSMDLIDGIAKILNFTYVFELVPDGKYGSLNHQTMQWDGLVKQLLDRKADLAICDLTITFERRSAVDFTLPFMTTGISILYRKPIKRPPELFSFMEPLSTHVWVYTAASLLGISLLLFVLARMSPYDWENPHPCNDNPEELENIWGIRNCMWVTCGSLMTQGCDILPKGVSSRWVVGVFWFFALIMTSSYTANMAAFLTNERMDSPIEDAEDLASQSKIKCGAVDGGSTQTFFRTSNLSTINRLWANMESARPSVFTKDNDEAVDRVIKEKGLYAFMMESTSIEYVKERNCDLSQIGGQLDSKGYGIAMPNNSPYRTAINNAVLRMSEGGDLQQLKTKWWKEMHGGGSCDGDKDEEDPVEAARMKIGNVGGLFLVLGIGCGVASAIAFLEFMWNVRKVAVEEKIRQRDAFMVELKFAFNLNATRKPVHHTRRSSSSSSTDGKDNKKIPASILRAASSFINLDKVY